jgi:hypothetical protein
MAWLSGVIFSRSMSQVSAMMFATVSKVEDIGNPLKCVGFWQWRRIAHIPPAGTRAPVRRSSCVPV